MSFPRYPKYKDSGVEWLGEVPEHWEVIQSRRLFCPRNEMATESDRQVTASQQYGILYQDDFVAREGRRVVETIMGTHTLRRVMPNDFVISLRSFQGGIEWSQIEGAITFHYVVLTPIKHVYEPFFAHLFKSMAFIHALRSTTNLIRDGQDLRFSHFVQVSLPITPEDEQIAIAAFLSQETAKIDELVAEQRRLIELLKEKRQAVISHAVTKGLNPNVPMKPSGIEWLGDVPEHWEVKPLGRLGQLQNGLNIGGEAFGAGDPFVSYGDVYKNANVPKIPSGLVLSTPSDQAKYDLDVGDVLFTRTSETVDDIGVASTCLCPIPRVTFAGFLIRFRPIEGLLEPRYSTFLFRNQGVQGHFSGTMNLVTRASLSQEVLKLLPICVPPIMEQQAIAQFIEQQVAAFCDLISEATRAIELLQERRTALISAAVTGKIDVRNFAPQVSEVA
jgi:type I restriction enzyme S subunit